MPVLTSDVENSVGTSANDTFQVVLGSLNPGDRIDGLGGIDTIDLTYSGALNLTLPESIDNIELVRGFFGNSTYIFNSLVFSRINTISGSTSDTIKFNSSGTYSLAAHNIFGVSRIEGSSGDDTILVSDFNLKTASSTGPITSIDGSGGMDVLRFDTNNSTDAANLDLSSSIISNIEFLLGRSNDDTFVLSLQNFSDLTRIDGGLGIDKIKADFSSSSTSITFSNDPNLERTGLGSTSILGIESIQLVSGSGSDIVTGWDGDDAISSGAGSDTLNGGDGNDFLDGGLGDDALYGGRGNDTLAGGDGSDTLIGGSGVDQMSGGLGDDIYGVDDTGDAIIEASGEGFDTVYSTFSYTLSSNVEALIFTGSADINSTGNEGGNVLIGNAGHNVLTGAGGDDLYGVDGNGDTVIEEAGGGYDEVYSSGDYALTANVETLFLTGSAYRGTGNNANNGLIGNDLDNLLEAGAGTFESLVGGGGNDLLIGGAGHDQLLGGTGADTFRFQNTTTDVFNSASNDGDFIFDFTANQGDKIQLNASAFGLSFGVVDGVNFFSGTSPAAAQATPTLLYNKQSGVLFYDADGSGAGGLTILAGLGGFPDLKASDFILY